MESKKNAITKKDRTGETCEKCKIGKYAECGVHDDWDGKITCDKCGNRVDRWRG